MVVSVFKFELAMWKVKDRIKHLYQILQMGLDSKEQSRIIQGLLKKSHVKFKVKLIVKILL